MRITNGGDLALATVTRRTFNTLLGAMAGGTGQAIAQQGSQGEAPSAGLQSKALAYLREKIKDVNGPGISVSVRKRGGELIQCALGMRDMDQGAAIGPDTVFHLASVTKQFTALAICLLARQKKLEVSSSIKSYFPGLPNASEISVADLIYHTAGLRDQLTLWRLSGRSFDDYISQDDMLRISHRQRGLNFQPGTEFSYSNTGYTLLAEIVRITSGKVLREFLADNVFSPLGMKNTFVNDEHGKVIPNRARSIIKDTDGSWRNVALNYQWWGPTSLHSTASDLTIWGASLLDPPVALADAIGDIFLPGHLRDGRRLAYGGGLQIAPVLGEKAFFHSGVDAAFRTHVLYIPAEGISVAVLANTPLAVQQIAADLAGMCFDRDVMPVMKKRVALAETHNSLVGNYASQNGNLMIIQQQGADLMIQHPGLSVEPSRPRKIVFREDGSFDGGVPEAVMYRVAKVRSATVVEIEETLGISGIPFIYYRVDERSGATISLNDYEGEYYSDELGCRYEIVAAKDALVAQTTGGEPIHFSRFAADRFASDNWHFTALDFHRTGNGKVTGFSASSSRATKIGFYKLPLKAS